MSKAVELAKETRQEYESWAAEKWGQSAYRHTSACSGEWDTWQAGWLAGRHAALAKLKEQHE